eukprot:TRINITY_DN694_c0_g1_i1.p1 TRINITY_DN694_c0_g1~~TRINITY_DN694_c0_g1_i1.p1  ORF type:complete len:247 (+),score=45.14 TRINITY_DN694_c0_g1_i1:51-743(+)
MGVNWISFLILITLSIATHSDTIKRNHCKVHPTTTSDDAEGPFFINDAPVRSYLLPPVINETEEAITVTGFVTDTGCQHLSGAKVEIWSAGSDGEYHDDDDLWYRGVVYTDSDGSYSFTTLVPGRYPLSNSLRPSHIHFKVRYDDIELTTQLYFSDDPYLSPNDPCKSCGSGEETLIRVRNDSGILNGTDTIKYWSIEFDIHLDLVDGTKVSDGTNQIVGWIVGFWLLFV